MGRRKKMGRPSKLTKEVIERLKQALSVGSFIEEACIFSGISRTSFYEYLDRGEEDDIMDRPSDFRTFYLCVKKTLAEAEMYSLKTIAQSEEKGDWRAAAWKLERRWPDKWGNRGQVLQHNVNAQVNMEGDGERSDKVKRISEILENIPDAGAATINEESDVLESSGSELEDESEQEEVRCEPEEGEDR